MGPLENPEVLQGTLGSFMGKKCASDARRSFKCMGVLQGVLRYANELHSLSYRVLHP